MNGVDGVAVAAAALALSALGIMVRLSVRFGRDSAKLDQVVLSMDKIERTIGNGEPGLLVRKESFDPLVEEVTRVRERVEYHDEVLMRHEAKLASLRD